MTRATTTARQPVVKTALFMRWMVLLLVVFDLLSAPLHAHAHEIGPAMMLQHASLDVHRELHGDPALSEAHSEWAHAEKLVHDRLGHSNLTLRAADVRFDATPTLDIIVSRIWNIVRLPSDDAKAARLSTPAVDHVPIPSLCTLRPEGRAPPLLHS